MLRFRISGISEDLAHTARTTLRSPQYGHPAHVETASGYGPCRLCLEPFREGEEQRILFTYQPFVSPGALPSPGPVFIHQEPCRRYDDLSFPEKLRSIPLVLESYGAGGRRLAQERVGARMVEDVLVELLGNPMAEYIHVRNAEAGCYIARVEQVFPCD
ncbi:MAG TPA: DUF1203 domain-containing protein [Gemmatimonadales bacterium]